MIEPMALFAVPVIATIVGTILALEAQAWAPHLSRRLLRGALAHLPEDLPEDLRARWAEEIEADLANFEDRPLGGLAFAMRVRRKGGRKLGAELSLRRRLKTKTPARASREGEASQSEEGEYRYYRYTIPSMVGPKKTYVQRYRVMPKREDEE